MRWSRDEAAGALRLLGKGDGRLIWAGENGTQAGGGRMILGVGTDLIEIARVQASLDRFGRRFMERVFTAGEIEYCLRKKQPAESFAARFAAKEAGAKALGTGISRGVRWSEIEVRRLPGERPTLHWSGRAQELAMAMGVRRTLLSLTHGRDLAMAVVIVER